MVNKFWRSDEGDGSIKMNTVEDAVGLMLQPDDLA